MELAVDLLTNCLQHGPQELRWCKHEAAKLNISMRTVERAAKKLKLEHFTEPEAKASNGYRYYWRLPARADDGGVADGSELPE